jgi:DNA polymerase alpha subunit A
MRVGANSSWLDSGVLSGRLFCDTMVSAQEFLSSQNNYSLSHLVQTQLYNTTPSAATTSATTATPLAPTTTAGTGVQTQMLADMPVSEVPHYFVDRGKLAWLAAFNKKEATFTLQLMVKSSFLALTKELSIECGHLWSRSLRAARAERVEYLLLHHFHKHGYLLPDKFTKSATSLSTQSPQIQCYQQYHHSNQPLEVCDADKSGTLNQQPQNSTPTPTTTTATTHGRSKPKYAGGLVLKPIRGLYDSIVLLLDFNSLYPSIIQQYNLCFTTIRYWEALDIARLSEAQLNQPSLTGASLGPLPLLLESLVSKRRAVKKQQQQQQQQLQQQQLQHSLSSQNVINSKLLIQKLEIRQQALKLVANSVYGCLGYIHSRFYCPTLAALTSAIGRHVLTHSVSLAQQYDIQVIYGDTDSLMIDTKETDYHTAIKMAETLREAINKDHRVLHLAIDSVFSRTLLLDKKKYAATKVICSQPIVSSPTSMSSAHTDNLRPAVTLKESLVVKGLEIVRRDWCGLSKEVSQFVLDCLLSSTHATRQDTVNAIYQKLESIAQVGQWSMQQERTQSSRSIDITQRSNL